MLRARWRKKMAILTGFYPAIPTWGFLIGYLCSFSLNINQAHEPDLKDICGIFKSIFVSLSIFYAFCSAPLLCSGNPPRFPVIRNPRMLSNPRPWWVIPAACIVVGCTLSNGRHTLTLVQGTLSRPKSSLYMCVESNRIFQIRTGTH